MKTFQDFIFKANEEEVKNSSEINENSKTFDLQGPNIVFTSSNTKDRAINILLKLKSFDEKDLMKQLGGSTNTISFKGSTGKADASNAYQILLKSDIEKATMSDAGDFMEEFFHDMTSKMKGMGYKFKRTNSTNGFHILSKDGLVTAYVVADPQNKF